MKYSLRILPAADADVDDAALVIAKDNLDAALRFYDAVDTTYREIRLHPQRWPRYELDHPRLVGLRKRAVQGFTNWLVLYQIIDKTKIQIVRVLHGARDIPAVLADELLD
jgi:plasmid stabilization system protein ParE